MNCPCSVGVKETLTSIDPPGAIVVPDGGTASAENGAPGSCTESMRRGWAPKFDSVTEPVRVPRPTTEPPNDTIGGLACSSASELRPMPVSENDAGPAEVSTSSDAAAGPLCPGVKETGTVTSAPAPSGVPTAGAAVPTTKRGLELEMPVIVRSRSVRSVTVRCAVSPSSVLPNAVAGPVTVGATGEPKPSTWPSRVPT